MRLAFKFGYDGTQFSGSQRQPEVTTVEGELLNCLIKHHVISDLKSSKFQVASRTDAGVSAIGNVFACNTDFKKKNVINILNSKLNHCWFYGTAVVKEDFNPRRASMRWYRYHIPKEQNKVLKSQSGRLIESKFNFRSFMSALFCFEGKHNFKNFANPQLEETIRTIESVNISEDDAWIKIDFKAGAFLWHQIRRIINACIKCATGKITEPELKLALEYTNNKVDFGLAPPEPLFLMDIEYDLNFEIDKEFLNLSNDPLLIQWNRIKLSEELLRHFMNKL